MTLRELWWGNWFGEGVRRDRYERKKIRRHGASGSTEFGDASRPALGLHAGGVGGGSRMYPRSSYGHYNKLWDFPTLVSGVGIICSEHLINMPS